MSLLPETASFEERVQECFLAHRGGGLMLSPLDVALVMAWGEAGVPYEVVARGIARAAERRVWDTRPGEPALRSLRACRREVEAEIKKWQARAAGRTHAVKEGAKVAEPPLDEPWHKARAVVVKLARERPELAGACTRLLQGPLSAPSPSLAAAARTEDLLHALLVRALPWPGRLSLYREARALGGGGQLGSPRARVLSRRFHRHALVRRALELPSFW
jgi:hypothetical protein